MQPAYWGSRALDYHWQGLCAYLRVHPKIRYLFAPVSIGRRYPAEALGLILDYYLKHYGGEPWLVESFNPLTGHLTERGLAAPTLYKQYTELCEPGGSSFLAFGVDAEFDHCVNGFILADLERTRAKKRERHIGSAS